MNNAGARVKQKNTILNHHESPCTNHTGGMFYNVVGTRYESVNLDKISVM